VETGELGCADIDGNYLGGGTICGIDDCPEPLSEAFTYQGQLKQGGVPVSDRVDLEFSLWTSPDGDQQVGETQAVEGRQVENGLFSVQLDFGKGAFNGDARWLEVAVCAHAPFCTPETFTTLAPRQPLTATPYALHTRGLSVDDDTGDVHAAGKVAADAFTGNSPIIFEAPKGVERMRIDESGNVGIGTTSPEAALHLKASGTSNSMMYLQSDSGGDAGFRLYEEDAVKWHIFNKAAEDDLRILNSDGSRVVFSAEQTSGRVGIGTTSPSQALTLSHGDFALKAADNTEDQSILFQNTGDNYTWRMYRTDAGNNNADLRLASGLSPDPTLLDDRVTFATNGHVGIGTPKPRAKLHIETSNSNQFLLTESDGTTNMRAYRFSAVDDRLNVQAMDDSNAWVRNIMTLEHDGNVGIGIADPSERLHVAGNIHADGTLHSGNSITIDGTSNTINSAGDLDLQTGQTSRLFLDNSTGNVGIGTEIPSAKLAVDAGAGTAVYGVSSSGSAGHFRSTSGEGLVVEGRSEITGDLTVNGRIRGTARGVPVYDGIYECGIPHVLTLLSWCTTIPCDANPFYVFWTCPTTTQPSQCLADEPRSCGLDLAGYLVAP
jgi:hypothetical protein